ncbi:MAG: helix-turn-helix transcriptional regulator [Lachnospiraceae bacterium]|nr:helix-turn-helix transcriptional regulator [Lachnospiraceae bacterium]
MPMQFKIDVLAALKEKGYNTNRLRTDKLLSEGAIQSLRNHKPISWSSLEKICSMLDCQPGDILVYDNLEG